jgi:putative transposase
MARAQRIEYEGAVYHVTVRGNERRAIFLDDRDRERFLRVLGESVESFDVRLYLFCLMGNHLHLVVETPRGNLGRFMHRLQTAYTVYFNRRHGRHGHLMQGRYGARLVEKEAYLLRLSRYVHLNPVFTGRLRNRPSRERIAFLRQYPWSSYRGYIGKDPRLAFVDYAPILVSVHSRGRAEAYRRFVETAVSQADAEFIAEAGISRLCIGSEAFRDRVQDLYDRLLRRGRRTEDVAFRRTATRVPVKRVLQAVSEGLGVSQASLLERRRDSLDRAVTSRMLADYAGLTQREAAEVLGLRSGAAVSIQRRRLTQRLKKDRRLARRVTAIAAELRPPVA